MAVDMDGSEIVEFYKGKIIFITGGTGFVGRVLVEHLLRKCNVKKIYILVRQKKGVEAKDRRQTVFNVPLFEKLRSLNPNFLDSIVFVNGDVSLRGLGIDEVSREMLTNEVQVVFHTAATVNLAGSLKTAAAINVQGTREMCRLCSKMKNLDAFVHVSTAYSNCNRDEIGEVVYDVPMTADDLIRVTESLSSDQVDAITKTLICGWPNTYTFTKAIAENIVKNYEGRMPLCIVRPGLVISTRNDPIEGWVDNIYGPIGFMSATAAGVLRVSHVNPEAKTEFIPADFVVSSMIAAGQQTGKRGSLSDVTVYNMVTDPENPINYGEFNKISTGLGHSNPPRYAVWYFSHTCIKNRLLYLFLAFWAHIFPAVIIDAFLLLTRKKPKVLKLYNKIHAFLDSVSFVSLRSWNFGNKNIKRLRASMNETDKKMFNFDMSSSNMKWKEMIVTTTRGTSYFLLKEDLFNSSAEARRKYFWLHLLHRTVQGIYIALFYGIFKLSIWTCQFLFSITLSTARHAICDSQ